MTTYISILRGINVSGQKVIKMDALKRLYENLGFENVRTYIQSGNVLFSSAAKDPIELESIIFAEIKTEFGFEVPVLVLRIEALEKIVKENPLTIENDKDISFLHVTFLASNPADYDLASILQKQQPSEEIAITANAVYLYCPNGYGKTKLHNSFLENKLKTQATTRNWKTINELLKLAQG